MARHGGGVSPSGAEIFSHGPYRNHADEVGKHARELFAAWGFTSIQSLHVDAEIGDLILNGRRRISFGAGTRGIFTSALKIALMKHALKMGHRHLGVSVLDWPLKAYAQKIRATPTATFRWQP